MANEVRRTVRVADPEGLHARPCAKIAREAQRFRCEVALVARGRTANAKSVIELLGLEVLSATEVEIRATGEGADECVRVVAGLLSNPAK